MAKHDRLDLPLLVAQGKRYRRAAHSRLLRMAVILLILLLPTVTLTYNIIIPTTQVYRLDASGEWTPFDLPMGGVTAQTMDLVADESGALWAVDGSGIMLNRYRDGRWEDFPTYVTGVELRDVTRITTDGDQLWGASGSSLFHFDGARWEVFADVLPTDVPVAIAAGPYGVFVIDAAGNLSRFWQGAWKHTPVSKALDGVDPEDAAYDESFTPTFMQAPDGTLWLAYLGLWKFSGDGWIRAHSDDVWNTAYYWLLGVTDEAVWYLNDYDIERFYIDGGEVESFSLQSIGMKNDYVWDSAFLGDQLWVMGKSALHVYDDTGWRTVTNPLGTMESWLLDLVSNGDDALYLTVYDPGTAYNPSGNSLSGLTLALITPLLLTAADFFLRYIPEFRQNRRRWTRMQPILATLPEFGGDADVRNPWNVRRFLGGYFVQIVFMLIAMTGVTFTLMQLFGSARVGLVFAVGAGLGYVVARLLVSGYLLSLSDTNMRTNIRLLMHGEYDYLLERNGYEPDNTDAQAVKYSNPTWQIFGLLLAGRHEEALPLLRQTLPGFVATNAQNAAMSVANVGYCLMHMERYDDALPYFEATAQLVPEMTTGYAALTHYYLNTESDPARALEMIEAAARFYERPLIGNGLTDYSRLGRQMSHALTLAFNERCAEGLALAARTANDRAMKLPVIAASAYADYGYLLQRCGHPDKAREHLEQALALDPNGAEGQRARRLLEKVDGSVATVEDATNGVPLDKLR